MIINLRKSIEAILLLITFNFSLMAADIKEVSPEERITTTLPNFEGFTLIGAASLDRAIHDIPSQPCACGRCVDEQTPLSDSNPHALDEASPMVGPLPTLKQAFSAHHDKLTNAKLNYCIRDFQIYRSGFDGFASVVKELIENNIAVLITRPIDRDRTLALYTIVGYQKNADDVIESFVMLGSVGKGNQRFKIFDARAFVKHEDSWPLPRQTADSCVNDPSACANGLMSISAIDNHVSMEPQELLAVPQPMNNTSACCCCQ